MPVQPPVTLIYVMGALRSGTTLLSTILGGLPGVLNAGELRYLWKQLDGSDWLCGCGEPMADCEFWKQVVLASGVDVPDAAAISRRYQASRLRIRNLRALTNEGTSDPSDKEYRAIMEGLLSGLRTVSGKPVILDNSKSAPDAVFYQRFTAEAVRSIHLVRDPRGVAYSMSKRKLHQLKGGATRPMSQGSAGNTASYWIRMNLAADRAAKSLPTTRLRYEECCRRPEDSIAALATFVGIEMPDALLARDGSFERPSEHTVTGNPDRWSTGHDRIRVDDRWRTEMPRRSSAAVTALTWPLLAKYGYPIMPRRST